MRDVNKIIVHCSDSDIPSHDNIETIRKWHVEENGWSDVGYHYFIQSTGDIQEGRPIEKAGAHVKNHNHDSIGICLHGKKTFTEAQFRSLKRLIGKLVFEYNIPEAEVYGHRDFDDKKTCPNFEVENIIRE
jgi:N-acetylmuramoyl-L-alanine amidase